MNKRLNFFHRFPELYLIIDVLAFPALNIALQASSQVLIISPEQLHDVFIAKYFS